MLLSLSSASKIKGRSARKTTPVADLAASNFRLDAAVTSTCGANLMIWSLKGASRPFNDAAGLGVAGCSTASALSVDALVCQGSETLKRLPLPGSLSTEMLPPCRSTRRCTNANPNPEPEYFRVILLSNWTNG